MPEMRNLPGLGRHLVSLLRDANENKAQEKEVQAAAESQNRKSAEVT
jgi:hypothetical protein